MEKKRGEMGRRRNEDRKSVRGRGGEGERKTERE